MTSICLLFPFAIESINDFEDAINLGTELLNEDASLINIGTIENTIKNNINMIEVIIIIDSKPLGSSVLRSRKSHIRLHKYAIAPPITNGVIKDMKLTKYEEKRW